MSLQNKNLARCRACDEIVSKKAKTCPHCGERKPYRNNRKSIFWIVIILVILAGIATDDNVTTSRTNSLSYADNSAKNKCQEAVRAQVTNPSTLNLYGASGFNIRKDSVGTIRVTQTFSAKNSFGLKLKYNAYCTINSQGDFNITIKELES